MTNRDRIMKTNLYDYLAKMADKAEKEKDVCIMTLLPNGLLSCPGNDKSIPCRDCVGRWLDMEECYYE